MSKFHITPSGQARTCSAKPGNCRYGENGVDPQHYATKEEAQKAYESLHINKTVPKVKKELADEKNIGLVKLSPKQIRGRLTPRIIDGIIEYPDKWVSHDLPDKKFNNELEHKIWQSSERYHKLKSVKELSKEKKENELFDISLPGNGTRLAALSIDSHLTQAACEQGGCLSLAYEIHHQTGLPIVSIGSKGKHWQGHVGILYNDSFYDINGEDTVDTQEWYWIDKLKGYNIKSEDVEVITIENKEEFYKKFNNGSDTFWHNDKFGQAVMSRWAQQVCEEHLGLRTRA